VGSYEVLPLAPLFSVDFPSIAPSRAPPRR
jgi:hypothetical protein